MKMKNILVVFLLAAVMTIIAACGNDGANENKGTNEIANTNTASSSETTKPVESNPTEKAPEKEDVKPPEPYTLTMWASGVAQEEIEDRFLGVLKEKFPHVTVEYVRSGEGTRMNEMVVANKIPDIIRIDVPTLYSSYLDFDIGYDLSDLVKQYNYDLNRFNKVFVDEIIDAGGALYGLPVPPYFPQVLYYNKDLFDKFGVKYPTDNMTWDQVYELAQEMTRTEDGIQYRGFSANVVPMLRDNPFSMPILDPATDGLHNSEKWQLLFEKFKRFYEIPNNKMEENYTKENNIFKEGNVAMYLSQYNVYLQLPDTFNWDIVAYPTDPDFPDLMPQRGPAYLAISSTNKHKEESFEMIMAMLSDEVQLADSRKGFNTTLVDKSINEALGLDNPVYSSKNMTALSVFPPADYVTKRQKGLPDVVGNIQQTVMGTAFVNVALGNADINTALRELDERLKLEVEKARSAQ